MQENQIEKIKKYCEENNYYLYHINEMKVAILDIKDESTKNLMLKCKGFSPLIRLYETVKETEERDRRLYGRVLESNFASIKIEGTIEDIANSIP